MIDGMVENMGVSTLWEKEGGNGLYPPPSLHVSIIIGVNLYFSDISIHLYFSDVSIHLYFSDVSVHLEKRIGLIVRTETNVT